MQEFSNIRGDSAPVLFGFGTVLVAAVRGCFLAPQEKPTYKVHSFTHASHSTANACIKAGRSRVGGRIGMTG